MRPRLPPRVFEPHDSISIDDLKKINKIKYLNPTISLYLTFTAESTKGSPKLYQRSFNSLRHSEIEKRQDYLNSLNHSQRESLKQDLEDIDEYLSEDGIGKGVKTLVIFKSNQELHQIINLPIRLKDALTLDVNAATSPLEVALQEYQRYLLAYITHGHSRFYQFQMGNLSELHQIDSVEPINKVDASRPEKVQRHHLDFIDKHYKECAQYIANQILTRQEQCLVITSDEDTTLKNFRTYLNRESAKRLIGSYTLDPRPDKKKLLTVCEIAIAEHESASEDAARLKLEAAAGKSELTKGLKEVVEAQNRFLVRRLFVSSEATQSGYICPTHRFLSLTAGSCPSCQQTLVSTENLYDELIELARLKNVELHIFANKPQIMAPYSHVAATLYS